ncbi:MAG: LLM class flavin-dependent oxidoreductase [Burkholderiales bacterium]|nr:LLM class flavin-dependent oxidoreductase [Burkholderiales bacterium]
MRFGLFGGATAQGSDVVIDSSRDYRHYVDYVCAAEALGFHSVFMVEHHFTGFNQVSASLTFLSYLAARTSRMRLGTAVAVLPWHNPVLLAEQAATVDLLSGGRLDFGVGRGYRHSEFAGFCIPMDEAEERYNEALAVIRKAWTTDGRFSHHGRRWHYEDVVVEPAPTQRPHPPLWVGAGNPEVIRAVAQDGIRVLLDQLSTPEVSGRRLAAYRDAVEAQGRTFDPMHVGLTRGLHLALNRGERDRQHALRAQFLDHVRRLTLNPAAAMGTLASAAAADPREATEATTLIGDPDEIIARLRALEALGIEYVLLMDLEGSLATLETFAREVMPAFAPRADAAVAA